MFGELGVTLEFIKLPFDVSGQMDIQNNMMSGLNQPDMMFHTGLTPNADMNFDGIFSGDGDEWPSNVADQQFR